MLQSLQGCCTPGSSGQQACMPNSGPLQSSTCRHTAGSSQSSLALLRCRVHGCSSGAEQPSCQLRPQMNVWRCRHVRGSDAAWQMCCHTVAPACRNDSRLIGERICRHIKSSAAASRNDWRMEACRAICRRLTVGRTARGRDRGRPRRRFHRTRRWHCAAGTPASA